MPCFKPLSAFHYYSTVTKSRQISFSRRENYDTSDLIDLPCGQCIGCRLERSRRWAVRLMHEASLHEKNSFLTLTYDDDHVPEDGSLNVKHFQDFMKRLRKSSGAPLRFFHCGEYGEKRHRPHYHCILFGEDFSADRELGKPTQSGDRQWHSPFLTKTWGMGAHDQQSIASVTFESCAYVARYCLKKVTNKQEYTDSNGRVWPSKEAHYHGRKPEYVTMSRRPGIGAGWIDRWGLDNVYRADQVVIDGRASLPPPFYDKLLEKADPDLFARVKRARSANSDPFDPETSSARLMVRREVKELTVKEGFKRGVE